MNARILDDTETEGEDGGQPRPRRDRGPTKRQLVQQIEDIRVERDQVVQRFLDYRCEVAQIIARNRGHKEPGAVCCTWFSGTLLHSSRQDTNRILE